jgi:prevent-host-death family protein
MKRNLSGDTGVYPTAPKGAPPSSVPAGQFKAICLDLLDRVKERNEEYVITKHGKPFAKLGPVDPGNVDPFAFLQGTVIGEASLVEPDNESWGESESDPLHAG